VTITVTNSRIQFNVYGTKYSLPVPDARIIFTTAVSTATTRFINNAWETTVPYHFGGDVFMGGLSWLVPNRLPGHIRNIAWTADISIDKAGVSLLWDWGAAVYWKFGDHPDLRIKPVSGWWFNAYRNKDDAGTPENYKSYLVPGATGSRHHKQYTGHHSRRNKVSCRAGNDHHFDKPPYWTWPRKITLPPASGKQGLVVWVGPNPSSGAFTLSVRTDSNKPITVMISDNFGNLIEKHERLNPAGVLRFGQRLKTGFYMVEVIQGTDKKAVKVLKIN
jgi:hypothetical protein